MKDMLTTKGMLNFALSSVPEGGKNASSINPALKAPILIRTYSLTSEKFKAILKLFVKSCV